LQSLAKDEGGIMKGEEFFYARDLRPSSSEYVPEHQGRGELAQTIEQAISYAEMKPVNLGQIPTPALTHYALLQSKGSMMITGSHIPFDRNGYKTNTSKGELLKQHEKPVNEKVKEVRERFYQQAFTDSLFDENGRFKSGSKNLSTEYPQAAQTYLQRYVNFFGGTALSGMRLLAYQHSAVGRDLVVEILRALGAEVVAVGRSETFVPIDTENMDAQQLAVIQNLYDHAASDQGQFDAIVSTDGDSDRPLLLGVDAQTAKVCFFGGDLVGMLTAELLGADAVVVPISSNDGIDHGNLKNLVEPKTRIGSPYVIAGMEQALAHGKQAVCGWEANGGFLTGSDMRWQNQLLTALPTRDAVLPIVAVLFMAKREAVTLPQLFTRLPKRYSGAGLIKQFPRTQALDIVKRLSPADAVIQTVIFSPEKIVFLDVNEQEISSMNQEAQAVETIKKQLSDIFSAALGFGNIARINYTDGVRIYFDNGDVAHLRPSGNADEFRLYAVADSQQRAERIVTLAVAEPDGLLRALSRQCTEF
jgi:phosphomannomutase